MKDLPAPEYLKSNPGPRETRLVPEHVVKPQFLDPNEL